MKLLLIILLIFLSACPLKEGRTRKVYKVGELPNANGIGYYEICKEEGSNETFKCN